MRLTITEIARCLALPSIKVERWIFQGKIPVRQNGQDCVFNQAVLEKWAAAHHLKFRLPGKKAAEQIGAPAIAKEDTLLSAMHRGGVFHGVSGADAEAALASAVALLPGLGPESKQVLLDRLLERERLTSTGIGKGVAIPHPRTPLDALGNAPLLSTFFLEQPAAYGAIDDKPVFVLFLLLSPSTQGHLHLLSRLAFCVRDNAFVSFLQKAPRAEALFEKIAEFEQKLDKN